MTERGYAALAAAGQTMADALAAASAQAGENMARALARVFPALDRDQETPATRLLTARLREVAATKRADAAQDEIYSENHATWQIVAASTLNVLMCDLATAADHARAATDPDEAMAIVGVLEAAAGLMERIEGATR